MTFWDSMASTYAIIFAGLLVSGAAVALFVRALVQSWNGPLKPGVMPGQRWAVPGGVTLEVVSISKGGSYCTVKGPGITQDMACELLQSRARLLPAADAVPELKPVRGGR